MIDSVRSDIYTQPITPSASSLLTASNISLKPIDKTKIKLTDFGGTGSVIIKDQASWLPTQGKPKMLRDEGVLVGGDLTPRSKARALMPDRAINNYGKRAWKPGKAVLDQFNKDDKKRRRNF